MVLKAWTGKKDKAATMKITAKVMALNVTESVFNVPDVSEYTSCPPEARRWQPGR